MFALAADGVLRGGLGWTAGIGWRQASRGDADDEPRLAGDMGLSTPRHAQGWGECTPAKAACRAARPGGDPEQDGSEV
ncbi:MAG: thiol oxidoreductase, partial [Pseudomonadota bacterium]